MRYLIITTINKPNHILKKISEEAARRNISLVIVGDVGSPHDFHLEHSLFFNVQTQKQYFNDFASELPVRHYARKNVGYLIAMKNRATIIQETDDDNIPLPEFWDEPQNPVYEVASNSPWYNTYNWFSDEKIWPRGFPLEYIHNDNHANFKLTSKKGHIYQGLANKNPDVDAIFRLTRQLPVKFKKKDAIILNKGVYCPFNSQNTIFMSDAYPLLYLPSTCSFRMTDIWRSFIAQRCLGN